MWVSADPALGRYLPAAGERDPSRLVGMGGVYNPLNLGLFSYSFQSPVRYRDPDGNAGQCVALLAGGPVGPVATAVCVGGTVLVLSAAKALNDPENQAAMRRGAQQVTGAVQEAVEKAKSWMLNESNQDAGSERPSEHGPRTLTDEERGRLSDAGRQPDSADTSGRTKAGRAGQKHGSRPGSAFPPVKGTPQDHNEQGQRIVDGILNDPGSTVEVDERGRTTVTAPDGRGVRYNPDGSLQGFREPPPPSNQN